MKYRKNTHDAPERPKAADVSPTYVPIFDENGNQRGHVHGLGASEATVTRFGVHDAKLSKRKGVLAWRGNTAPARPNGRHAQAVRTAKGSVTKNPTRPETTARPKR